MNVVYIGSGFVGACSAAVSAASGHNVLVYDIDEKKINALSSQDRDEIESCLYEKGLGDLLIRNKERINFTIDYKDVENFVDNCDAIFMCLPTPEVGETGESDLSYYNDAAEKLSQVLKNRNEGKQTKYITIINKSTVPIDMVTKTEEIMDEARVKKFGVVSNPEFLVEGKAIQGSLHPERIVVGAWKEKDFEVMRNLYRRYYDSPNVKYIEANPKEAAAGKLLSNYYLFNKLQVCFDVIGRTCETFEGVNFEQLRNIMSTDSRIGNWGFYNSLYAGGSCFIKDSRSLAHQLQTAGQEASMVNETYLSNKRQLELFIGRPEKELKFDWHNKVVTLLGTAFKRDTNDIRNSASIDIVHFLNAKSVAKVQIYDPAANVFFKQIFPETETINYCDDELEALSNSDVIIISTDWPQFRHISDILINKIEDKPLIMDGRRMLSHDYKDLKKAGFNIIAVGSPLIKGNK